MKSVSSITAAVRDYFTGTMKHPVGFLGINLTSFAGVLLVILLVLESTGGAANPYIGIVTFMILPALFVAGLLLMPLGHYLARKRQARGQSDAALFPILDLNRGQTRNRFVIFLIVTLVNVSLLAVATYHGIEFMDSVEFCGETCHEVMHPELTAYLNSPHSRVRCVDCHIGPGASWFVKSKLSGTRQVFAAMLKTYPRPIPTPVHNLRPALETCEQCHWPQKFHGNKLVVKTHFQDDEANTPMKSVLALRIGGGQDLPSGEASIHWHINNRVEYLSDENREQMYWVLAERPDGTVREYFRPGLAAADPPTFASLPDSLKHHPKREMDCVDCHNRPTHIYKPALMALDEAMTLGRVPADLPYLHREAMAALQESYPDKETGLARIRERLGSFYRTEYPDLARERAADVEAAVNGVSRVYADNVFPAMNISWDTYPNHIGHQYFPGCFRCHDDEMATAEGETIAQDCASCHSLLAMEEENPEILQDLFPED